MEEEIKSNGSNGSFPRAQFGSSNKKGGKNKAKGNGKGGDRKGYDSYSESDEGVNDSNAMFQARDLELHNELFGGNNGSKGGKGGKGKGANKKKKGNNMLSGGMNDDLLEDHSESDEGVNQGNPLFQDNNQIMFKKRGAGGRDQSNSQNRNGSNNNSN